MAYTRLVSELNATASIAMVADKTKDSEMYETFLLIYEALETKKASPQWKPAYEAFKDLKALVDTVSLTKLPKRAELEVGLKAVAQQFSELTLDKKDKNFAMVLVGAFEGLCLRCEHLDQGKSLKYRTKNALIKPLLKKFNATISRRQNLDPLMESVNKLRTQIQNFALEPTLTEAAIETNSTLPEQKDVPTSLPFANQKTAIINICKIITKCNLRLEKLAELINEETSTAQIKAINEKIEAIAAMVFQGTDICTEVENAFNSYQETLKNDPEYLRLDILEGEVNTKLALGKVIEYDENLANKYRLTQEDKDAWRQRAYIDYENTMNVKSLYNRARMTANLFQVIPIFGHAVKVAGSAARYLPGSQMVMGSQVSHSDVMQRLKKAIKEEKNILTKSPLNLETHLTEVREKSVTLLMDIHDMTKTLRNISDRKELTQRLRILKNGINDYIKANNGLVSSFLRLFGVETSRYKLAQELLGKLGDENKPKLTLSGLNKIVSAAHEQLGKPRKENKLVSVISEYARRHSS